MTSPPFPHRRTFPLGVYVHIPFCAYRCRYCNFTFETGWSDELVERTLDAIVDEARSFRQRSEAAGYSWNARTLYVGGGTPSVIPPASIEGFFRKLREALGLQDGHKWQEATFEINPENMTEELLDALERSGIDRLSVGVQTFDDAQLQKMGRRCTQEKNEAALSLVRKRWKSTWSVDLMSGFPGQTWIDLRSDLQRILEFGPPHISLYSLIVEPKTALAKQIETGKLVPLPATVQDQLWIRACQTLQNSGFDWYEISNFARPGHTSKHNFAYWNLDPYVGLGPGAAGTVPAFDSEENVSRTQNPKLFPYLAGERPSEILSPSEFYLEHLLSGLRTTKGILLPRIEAVFGPEVERFTRKQRQWIEKRGWADPETDQNRLILNDCGRLALDRLLIEVEQPPQKAFRDRICWPFEESLDL